MTDDVFKSQVQELFEAGQASLLDKAAEQEATKAGTFRVGSCGMVDERGEVLGGCLGDAYLRYLGVVVSEVDTSRDLMFAGGRANEDIWTEYLSEVVPPELIHRETEIPVELKLPSGRVVTGRPDIVLESTDVDLLGLELKQVCSLWNARDVLFGSEKKPAGPKLMHVIQAAMYSYLLAKQTGQLADGEFGGIPYEICYTNRTDFAVTGDWIKKLFPAYGEPGSEHCEYGYYRNDDELNARGYPIKRRITPDQFRRAVADGEDLETVEDGRGNSHPRLVTDLLKVLPFTAYYPISIAEDGQVGYQDREGNWHGTIVTIPNILRFYETLDLMASGEITEVPSEPKLFTALGEKLNYKHSDYCDLSQYGLCTGQMAGKDLSKWVAKIRKVLDSSK